MPRPSSTTGKIVNRAELAGILARSPPAIDTMVRSGCPQISRGGSGTESEFNTAEVIKWLLARERDAVRAEFDPEKAGANEGKRRFTAAAAELKELQLAEKRGELVSITAVTAKWIDECVAVRSRLLAIPDRVAPKIVGMSDPAAIEAALRDEVIAALSELTQS